MIADEPKNHRRWLRFSLRTLLFAVTLVAAFIAYHVNWIRQRHEVISGQFDPDIGFLFRDRPIAGNLHTVLPLTPRPPRGPGLTWLFGERGYPEVQLLFGIATYRDRGFTPAELSKIKQIERLFPESKIEPIINLVTPD